MTAWMGHYTQLTKFVASNDKGSGLTDFPATEEHFDWRVSRGFISGEEPLPRGHGTDEMPVWGPVLSQVEADRDLGRVRIDNLARYLQQLQRP